MNSVQVMGNLARDPVIRATKTGRAVASFTVAVNRNYTTPQGEQKELICTRLGRLTAKAMISAISSA